MRITVDPNTDSSGLGYAAAGKYHLRVTSCEQIQGPNYPYLAWRYEFADPNVKATDGKSKVGNVFDNTTLKSGENSQFALRRVLEALGFAWTDFETTEAIGREFDANVVVGKDNKGMPKNEIGQYIPKAK